MKRIYSVVLAAIMLCTVLSFAGCKKEAGKTINVKSASELKDLKIGTQKDSSALGVLKDHADYNSFKDNISEYTSYDEAILDLQAGRIDVIVVDEVLGEYKNSKLTKKMAVSDFDFGDDFYAIGCRNGETDVANKLNGAIKTLVDNGKAAEISKKWFGKNIVIFENYASMPSKTEVAGWDYIQNKGKLVVGLDDTFAPMGFRDEKNNLVGFDIDLAKAVGEELGVAIEFKPIDWDAKELELSSKNIDCIWNGMSANDERLEKMSLTKKYLNNKLVIMSLEK